jgi:hypothetical protein
MTEKEAILLLITYNDWRRGDEIPMPEPKQLGIAIDTVIQLWKERNNVTKDNCPSQDSETA